jgi:hypothetical protein
MNNISNVSYFLGLKSSNGYEVVHVTGECKDKIHGKIIQKNGKPYSMSKITLMNHLKTKKLDISLASKF